MGNTSVFYTESDVRDITQVKSNDWINTSNHDSCWRSDGFALLDKLYFEMANKVNPNIPPIEIQTEARLSIGLGYPVKHCNVIYKADETINNHYKIIKIENDDGRLNNLSTSLKVDDNVLKSKQVIC